MRKRENGIENKAVCTECGGRCCKRMGCEVLPEDVIAWYGAVTIDVLRSMLRSGDFSIDWYERFRSKSYGTTNGYYIRARNVGAPVVDPAYAGHVCAALTPTGCKFDFEHRPTGGRALIPHAKGNCTSPYTKLVVANAWDKYHKLLEKLFHEFL